MVTDPENELATPFLTLPSEALLELKLLLFGLQAVLVFPTHQQHPHAERHKEHQHHEQNDLQTHSTGPSPKAGRSLLQFRHPRSM